MNALRIHKNIFRRSRPQTRHGLARILAVGLAVSAARADDSLFRLHPAETTAVRHGVAGIEADYWRIPDVAVDRIHLELVGTERQFDLTASLPGDVLTQLRHHETGRLRFPLTVRFLPPGEYKARLGLRMTQRDGNGLLQGKGMIVTRTVPTNGDMVLRYRFKPLDGGHNLMLRVPPNLRNDRATWNFYFLQVHADNVSFMLVRNYGGNRLWDNLGRAAIPALDPHQWHEITVRCEGFTFQVTLNDQDVLSVTDPDKRYPTGDIGFWQWDENSLFDDVRILSAEGAEPRFADDFTGETLDAERWRVSEGDWRHLPGELRIVPPQRVATLHVPTPDVPPRLPRTEIRRIGDANTVWVNGEPLLPMMLAISTLQRNPNDPFSYELPRRSHLAGIPILAPTLPQSIGLQAGGELDFTALDDQMTRLASACPDAYILPRLNLPQPGTVPPDERTDVRYGPEEDLEPDKKSAIMRRFSRFSTASETYRDFAVNAIGDIFSHIERQPYADRILGMNICGIGYESNWGAPGSPYGMVIDNAPAMNRLFAEYLHATYGSDAELRRAWNDDSVSIRNPRVPGLRERFESDFLGFRDPANPVRRPTLDYHQAPRGRTLEPLWDRIGEQAPNLFTGIFGLYTYPTRNTALDRMRSDGLHRHPAIKFVVGCLTGTRQAGDESIYTNAAFESARLHHTIALAEADIRTVMAHESHRRNPTFTDTIQVMRREFGHAILTKRQAIWYYELQVGWFDHPLLNAEFAAQVALGRQAIRVPHQNVSDAAVFFHGPGWQTWAGWSESPMEPGFTASRGIHEFVNDTVRSSVASIGRAGFARDMLEGDDLFHPDRREYHLYLFPSLFHAPARFREKLHALAATRGATVFLTYAAGITDESGIGLDKMRDLLGMEIDVDPTPAPMACRTVGNEHPILRDLPDGTPLGNPLATGYRFHVTDPEAIPLAVYADGRTAVAVKPMGKGQVVYSAVPIVQSAFYRGLGRFSGCHLYTEANDDLRTDNHFIMLHSGPNAEGKRTLHLPRPVRIVYDLISGDIVATDTDQATVFLPAKTTGLWYYGCDPEWVRGLSLGVFTTANEPETP